ncbi:hypothetical protein [Acinetobacter stercoris]|uniref:Uncharacterized protein n=1 Tax=Acinetobacter stercoris TaxID=2126983 RepID=A0A2U3N249_9GAMM|nr:hypothetical protein [Acinetobacter stercoris]SPL71738.1 hypothetical protein KPC_2916 [Acinetobacter stercoris]
MPSDVEVQFFSHLNGLKLDNNWGDLIRLLDTCLVNGLPLTVSDTAIDEQGDIYLTTSTAHNCLLFQIIELSGFEPEDINGKYRIKGIPATNQLILKAEHLGQSIYTIGETKLASLGYEIIFRDTADVKRVYRAKNPKENHPYIRVDESISSDTGSYTSTYAKFAMVGLLENMTHIDDYNNPDVLQLPFDPTNPAKNWIINGTGTAVVRGWSRWYWARGTGTVTDPAMDSATPTTGGRAFTLIGDIDAFYLVRNVDATKTNGLKSILCCGLYHSVLKNDVIPNWFLGTILTSNTVSVNFNLTSSIDGSLPLAYTNNTSKLYVCNFNEITRISNHILCDLLVPDYGSGYSGIYGANNIAALEIPLADTNKYLRGTLKHIYYNGKALNIKNITPYLADKSMYIADGIYINGAGNVGSPIFYLGEIE